MIRVARYLITMAALVAAAWLAGLLFFVMTVQEIREPVIGPGTQETDAIVVLTGGSERLPAGLDLLMAHKARKLFISGVHAGLTLDQLLAGQKVPKDLRACCIILGHAAESTIGNAEETLAWMEIEQFHSLRLVTANYHMPRSLMAFHAMMPWLEIVPHPIAPDSVKLADWWLRPGTASLLVTEYNKYLYAALRLRLMGL